MPTNMPGGKLIAGIGGHIVPIDPVTGTMTHLDVASWTIERDIHTAKCAHSGTFGAIGRRITGLDWKAHVKIWWDLDKPPEALLYPSVWGCGIQLGLGSAEGQSSYGYTTQQFYYSPSCFMTKLTVNDSSQGDDIVTAEAILEGNSKLFLLPNQMAQYTTYTGQLQGLGQYVALAQFSTMLA